MPKKQKQNEKGFHSLKKLWLAYKIARRSGDTKAMVRYATKITGLSKGMFKKGLIEKMPTFAELKTK